MYKHFLCPCYKNISAACRCTSYKHGSDLDTVKTKKDREKTKHRPNIR